MSGDIEYQNLLNDVSHSIIHLIKNISLKKEISNFYEYSDFEHHDFWHIVSANFLDMSVSEWCKLFGSDHKIYQPIHWKNVLPKNEQGEFKENLLNSVRKSEDEWNLYWEEMKKYRDLCVAHYGSKDMRTNIKNYPYLDTALESSFFYYKYLVPKFRKNKIQVINNIDSVMSKYREDAKILMIKLITK